MKQEKTDWKIETIKELRTYKVKKRLLRLIEIIYHTAIPIMLTNYMVKHQNPLIAIPLLIIILVRIKIK